MSNKGTDYVIPFGIDARNFFESLIEIDQGIDKVAANVAAASKDMQTGFVNASNAGEKLSKTLSIDAEKAATLGATAKTVGKEIAGALNSKAVDDGLSKKVETLGVGLNKLAAQGAKPLKFNIETAKLEYFNQLIHDGADEFEVLNQVVEFTRERLKTLDPNSQEWQELSTQLGTAEEFLKNITGAAGDFEGKSKTLKAELREMKANLAAMEMAGQGNTEEFRDMARRAGELEDQIGDVSARVRVLASDTKYLDAGIQAVGALAGAFTAAQGAAALFGDENEEVQKVIAKVTGAMAILQGIQAVSAALNKDSALSVLLFSRAQQGAAVATAAQTVALGAETTATVTATTATRGFTAALLANPLTAIAVLIAAVVVALISFSSNSKDAEMATANLNRELENQNDILSLNESSIKRRTDLAIAQAKKAGASESEIGKLEGRSLQERYKLRQDYLNGLVKQYNDEGNARNVDAETRKALGSQILKTETELADLGTQIQIKRLDVDRQVADEGEKAQKKREEQGKKSLEDAKKRAETERQILEQQRKFAQELRAAQIDGIQDAAEKERAQAKENTRSKIEDLEAEKSLSKEATKNRNALIIQLRENLGTTLKDIDKREAVERAKIQFEAQQLIADLMEDGAGKEIELIELNFEEKRRAINEQYKNEEVLRAQLIEAVNKAEERVTKEARDKITRAALQENEQRAILEVETAAKFLGDFPRMEEQKGLAVLEVRLKFARKNLEVLLSQGEDENSIIVLQAKKQVQELEKAYKGAAAELEKGDGKGIIDFQKLIFGDQGDEGNDAIGKALKTSYESIRQITDFIVEQYQRQIDKKQEVIDGYNDDIKTLEDQMEDEKRLRDEGLANNVDAIQAEIDAKKAARDEELKQQEELQRKQQAIQKAQFALDTAIQFSNLITAASNIFKTLSSIPFVGVPLAIATIGLMTGAFITSKVKAAQAINDGGQRFEEGGWIRGKSHAQGGKKFISTDGERIELEGAEFVTKKKQAAKYGDLLEAINNDDIAGMSDFALKNLLAGMGIHLHNESPKEALGNARERDKLQTIFITSPKVEAPEMSEINDNVRYLATVQKNRVERWDDNFYTFEKRGNKITKIKKT